jgi:hypothetical protein
MSHVPRLNPASTQPESCREKRDAIKDQKKDSNYKTDQHVVSNSCESLARNRKIVLDIWVFFSLVVHVRSVNNTKISDS